LNLAATTKYFTSSSTSNSSPNCKPPINARTPVHQKGCPLSNSLFVSTPKLTF